MSYAPRLGGVTGRRLMRPKDPVRRQVEAFNRGNAGEITAILERPDPLGMCGCGFFHVRGGRIVFQRGYWDKLSFLKLHGLPVE